MVNPWGGSVDASLVIRPPLLSHRLRAAAGESFVEPLSVTRKISNCPTTLLIFRVRRASISMVEDNCPETIDSPPVHDAPFGRGPSVPITGLSGCSGAPCSIFSLSAGAAIASIIYKDTTARSGRMP